jgi:hypothetical protein
MNGGFLAVNSNPRAPDFGRKSPDPQWTLFPGVEALETVVAKRLSLRQPVWPERQTGATMKEMRELTIRRDV